MRSEKEIRAKVEDITKLYEDEGISIHSLSTFLVVKHILKWVLGEH